MPYPNERAGFSALQDLEQRRVIEAFGDRLERGADLPPKPLPPFESFRSAEPRPVVVALDGSSIYHRIPARLPCTEAGLISIAIVRIDLERLESLPQLPESRATDPVQLRETEDASTLQLALPGRNARSNDGRTSREWFRAEVQATLQDGHFGGENLAATLHAVLGAPKPVKCPNRHCGARPDPPAPGRMESACDECGTTVLLSDALRAQEIFSDEQPCGDAHGRVRQALEILSLVNLLRELVKLPAGRRALRRIAFVMDGPLAAFSTIARVQPGVLKELRRIDELLWPGRLLVMSGVKTGAFVQHFSELDEAPEPDARIREGTAWLPDDDYIRENIIGRDTEQPWGEITYFGRPLVVKTHDGQRLLLNLAQPEADQPLTNAPEPKVLDEAIATAARLGVGRHEFLPLRRAHAKAAIPFRAGAAIIESLASA